MAIPEQHDRGVTGAGWHEAYALQCPFQCAARFRSGRVPHAPERGGISEHIEGEVRDQTFGCRSEDSSRPCRAEGNARPSPSFFRLVPPSAQCPQWHKCEVLTGPGNVFCLGQTGHTKDLTKLTRSIRNGHRRSHPSSSRMTSEVAWSRVLSLGISRAGGGRHGRY
jgi:hypothetical protein